MEHPIRFSQTSLLKYMNLVRKIEQTQKQLSKILKAPTLEVFDDALDDFEKDFIYGLGLDKSLEKNHVDLIRDAIFEYAVCDENELQEKKEKIKQLLIDIEDGDYDENF